VRIVIDEALCEGNGVCEDLAATVFEVTDDSMRAHVIQEHPPESLRADVEAAVRACPRGAILIIEES
jgi:ferredoxin